MPLLRLIVIHGTFAPSAKWRNSNSVFMRRLFDQLKPIYPEIELRAIQWGGSNRWRTRDQASNQASNQLAEHLRDARQRDQSDEEYLIVGHSHGGNIATEGARKWMENDPTIKLRGVACLNTPFLKRELRATSSYIYTWLAICLLMGGAFAAAAYFAEVSIAATIEFSQTILKSQVQASALYFLLFLVVIGLFGLATLNRKVVEDAEAEPWGPSPRVLCLSCADDEAITLLGLLEGIANLPQLLFHPVALVVSILATILGLTLHPAVIFCTTPQCIATGALSLGFGVITWAAAALIGGLIGSLIITIIFGLNARMFVESLVSRVLVSYVPLRPAIVTFRAIVNLKGSPRQLLHSRLYQSPSAIDEICNWVINHTDRRIPEEGSSAAVHKPVAEEGKHQLQRSI